MKGRTDQIRSEKQSRARAPVKAKGIDLNGRLALRTQEAAEALGVCEKTMRQIGTEIGRVHRGKLVLYPIDGIREWLKREAQASEDEVGRMVREELDALAEGD